MSKIKTYTYTGPDGRPFTVPIIKDHDWHPIETAPTDGTEVLTYREAGCITVAQWVNSFGNTAPGWCVTDGMYVVNVTHWMPLPDPPK